MLYISSVDRNCPLFHFNFYRKQYDGVELMGMGDDGDDGLEDLELEMSFDGLDLGSPGSAVSGDDDGEFSGRLSPGTLALAGEFDDEGMGDDIDDFAALDSAE